MTSKSQGGIDIAGLLYLCIVFSLLFIPAFFGGGPYSPPGSEADGEDSGGGGGGGGGPRRPLPRPSRPSGGLPLPDAEPARVRLRDHMRLTDKLPTRIRRPAREPTPERVPLRQRP
jgi:hypothetical protein